MTDKLFDDFIKDKLQNHSSAVPADMWDRIVREKVSKRIAWWKPAGIAVLFICLAIFFSWFGPLGKNETPAVQSHTSIDHSLPVSTKKIDNTNDIKSLSAVINKVSSNNINKRAALAMIKNNAASARAATEPATDLAIGKPGIKAKSGHKIPGAVMPVFSKSIASTVVNPLIFASEIPGQLNNPETSINQYHFADKLSLLAARQKIVFENSAKELSQQLRRAAFAFSSVDCPSDRMGRAHGLYAAFFVSPDIAFKKMAYKNTAANNYSTRNDSTAAKMLSYTVGVRLTKEIGQNMVFKTGIQYSQINEKFDYRNENERNRTTVVTVRTITNSNGTTSTIRDTSIVEQVGYRVKTTYNHYRSWDIPVILGYEISGEGWKANLNGGAVFNISSSQTGDFLDTSNAPVPFSKSTTPIFKTKAGVSLYARA